METTLKAGCILVNKLTKCVALIYEADRGAVSFPKGHVDDGETLEMCAVRETEEEIKHSCKIITELPCYVVEYDSPFGEHCRNQLYIALDTGICNNPSIEYHEVWWAPIEEVEELLTYSNLIDVWKDVKPKILNYLEKN